MFKPLPSLVCVPGVREGGDDGNEIWRRGKEEGLHVVPSKALDDAVDLSVTIHINLGYWMLPLRRKEGCHGATGRRSVYDNQNQPRLDVPIHNASVHR